MAPATSAPDSHSQAGLDAGTPERKAGVVGPEETFLLNWRDCSQRHY